MNCFLHQTDHVGIEIYLFFNKSLKLFFYLSLNHIVNYHYFFQCFILLNIAILTFKGASSNKSLWVRAVVYCSSTFVFHHCTALRPQSPLRPKSIFWAMIDTKLATVTKWDPFIYLQNQQFRILFGKFSNKSVCMIDINQPKLDSKTNKLSAN